MVAIATGNSYVSWCTDDLIRNPSIVYNALNILYIKNLYLCMHAKVNDRYMIIHILVIS